MAILEPRVPVARAIWSVNKMQCSMCPQNVEEHVLCDEDLDESLEVVDNILLPVCIYTYICY